MKRILRFSWAPVAVAAIMLTAFVDPRPPVSYRFPYKNMGLTEREAAAHLLSRFSFGAAPGDIDQVVKAGLENWFEQQLTGIAENPDLTQTLSAYKSLTLSNEDIVHTYPRAGQVLRMAVKEGDVQRDSVNTGKKEYKDELKDYMKENGLRPQSELLQQLVNQKVLRARYSNNQLKEVMADFWFNHFNVAVGKGGVQQYVTGYERDVIRPNVLGKFESLLLATAKSPAMLAYLDNNKSTVNPENANSAQMRREQQRGDSRDRMTANMQDSALREKIRKPKMQGLNENYAREIMELHTLGVDGGYTQSDVTQAARILTGWSINPEIEYNLKVKQLANRERLEKQGFVIEDDFFFAANKHDQGEKTVLGAKFRAGRGYDEGLELIHLLASHPSTAKFISRKLAVRFVSDKPSQSLIDKMSASFLTSGGDIKTVLITMASAAEFWAKDALREKTKAPFELAISAARSVNAQVMAPFQLYQWVNKMGQKMYNYQAPTGFPDRGQYWINTGSLLNRMNFGLALAAGRIPGIKVDLLALNNNHEPESPEDALQTFSKILLPERDLEETVKRLTPMLTDPELQAKVDEAASQTSTSRSAINDEMMMDDNGKKGKEKIANKKNTGASVRLLNGQQTMLSQVVGIIIGSPEFQRR